MAGKNIPLTLCADLNLLPRRPPNPHRRLLGPAQKRTMTTIDLLDLYIPSHLLDHTCHSLLRKARNGLIVFTQQVRRRDLLPRRGGGFGQLGTCRMGFDLGVPFMFYRKLYSVSPEERITFTDVCSCVG